MLLAIFDIDGTLADNRERIRKLGLESSYQFDNELTQEQQRSVEKIYLDPTNLLSDPINAAVWFQLKYYLHLRDGGKQMNTDYQRIRVGVVTTRPASVETTTKEWLSHQVDLSELDFIHHRPLNMLYDREKVLAWKVAKIKKLRNEHRLTTLVVFDDDIEVLKALHMIDGSLFQVKEGIPETFPSKDVAK